LQQVYSFAIRFGQKTGGALVKLQRRRRHNYSGGGGGVAPPSWSSTSNYYVLQVPIGQGR